MKPKLTVKVKLKPGVDLGNVKGFNWNKYDNEKGVHWSDGLLTIYSFENKVRYETLSQEVLNRIIELCSAGVLVLDKN